MSKSGHWDSISQIDSNSFANCPYQVSNDFVWEHDYNPQARRRKDHFEWVGEGQKSRMQKIQQPEIESFYRISITATIDSDCDTIDDFYVGKEILLGAVIESKGSNYNGWSIVVRTVIMWEERALRKKQETHHIRNIESNNKPSDIKEWEKTHGIFRSRTRFTRRSRKSSRGRIRCSKDLGATTK